MSPEEIQALVGAVAPNSLALANMAERAELNRVSELSRGGVLTDPLFNFFGSLEGSLLESPERKRIREQAELSRVAELAMNLLPAGGIAYHGTPAKFSKFSKDMIGSGQGAATFGHGFYFAESDLVAKSYQKYFAPGKGNSPKDTAARVLESFRGDKEAAKKELMRRRENALKNSSAPQEYETVEEAILDLQNNTDFVNRMDEAIKAIDSGIAQSNIMKVEIPDSAIDKMLDWDRKISSQKKHIRDALRDVQETMSLSAADFPSDVYNQLAKKLGSKEKASSFLQSRGIPGIKYFDQASRESGLGTRNFVVFDESLPKVLEVNGEKLQTGLLE